ncbi:MAG: Bug family tripartite tricarboxylate transporter substrate binding protein [Candidatus Binatia bacterium]
MREAFLLVILLLWASSLFGQEPFYHGKTIRVIVGSSPGNTQDQMTRLVARQLPKYIQGNPAVIVENMAGTSSMIAANYLFRVSKADGLTMGVVSRALYFDQLVGRKEVQFDWAKFTWIGSPVQGNELLFVGGNTPYKSIRDVANSSDVPKCGASGTTSTGYYIPKLMNEIFGTKFHIVTGYSGGSEMDLAVQRGETHCRATSISGFTGFGAFKDWRQSGSARVLVQTGRKRDLKLPDVPTVYELMADFKTSEWGRRLAALIVSPGEFGWPIVAPPGIPADRVEILRGAFMKALADPELIAEAKKRQLDLHPSSGEELEVLAREVIAQPREVIERMRGLLGN